jgi:hypothetical protein
MIGFHLTFARKETVYNRNIGHFTSWSVGLLKMSIEATDAYLLRGRLSSRRLHSVKIFTPVLSRRHRPVIVWFCNCKSANLYISYRFTSPIEEKDFRKLASDSCWLEWRIVNDITGLMELHTCDCQFVRELKGYGRMRYIAKREFKEQISFNIPNSQIQIHTSSTSVKISSRGRHVFFPTET